MELGNKDVFRFRTLETCFNAAFIQDVQSSCHTAMLQLRSTELSKILLPAALDDERGTRDVTEKAAAPHRQSGRNPQGPWSCEKNLSCLEHSLLKL